MTCQCSVCKYSRKVRAQLVQLNPEQREFFETMYDILIETEMDRDYCAAIVDGSWPAADTIIAERRKLRQVGVNPK